VTAIAVSVRRPGVGKVYAWELRKLAAQKRTYIGLGCAVLVPLIFITALLADDGGPEGIPFSDLLRETVPHVPVLLMALMPKFKVQPWLYLSQRYPDGFPISHAMLTSSGSRVLRDGTMATSSNP